jgi:hypothetical protein
MASQRDVRRIALSFEGVHEVLGRFAFAISEKGKERSFCWVWQERVHPKKPRVPNPKVLAIRVKDEAEKALLLDADEDKFFTEPHYDGFPAVLVRLNAVGSKELRKLLVDALRCVETRKKKG